MTEGIGDQPQSRSKPRAEARRSRGVTRVFISYRRADTQEFANALYAALSAKFAPAKIFMDTAAVRSGERWDNEIDRALDQAALVLVLIGPRWMTLTRDGKPRIEQEDDWVRREVRSGLPSRLVPVLYTPLGERDTRMPESEQLPRDIRGMVYVKALSFRSEDFGDDLHHLERLVRERLRFLRRRGIKIGLGVLLGLLAIAFAFVLASWPVRRVGLEAAKTREEARLAVRSSSTVPELIKETYGHDSMELSDSFELVGRRFDLTLYLYNNPANQLPNYLFLIDLYDPSSKSIDWATLEDDGRAVLARLSLDEVRRSWARLPGPRPLLMIPSYWPDEGLRPPLICYVQVVGRRGAVSGLDIERMASVTQSAKASACRVVVTYDAVMRGRLGI